MSFFPMVYTRARAQSIQNLPYLYTRVSKFYLSPYYIPTKSLSMLTPKNTYIPFYQRDEKKTQLSKFLINFM